MSGSARPPVTTPGSVQVAVSEIVTSPKPTPRRAFYAWWSLAAFWTVLVSVLSLMSAAWAKAAFAWVLGLERRLHLPEPAPVDKVLHALTFLALGLIYATALGQGSWARVRARAAGLCLLGLAALSGTLELLQFFVPERTPDWADLAANLLGVSVGLGLPLLLGSLWRARRGARAA